MPSYYIQTLGCPKNEVDSQKIKAYLAQNSYSETKLADADLVIVNTCGFIEPAKAESIETIFSVNKKRKKNSKLIVTGCLAQRYQRELEKEMPEVDLVAPLEADFLL
jgi:ribosomal protein S12 methylthiotransferase